MEKQIELRMLKASFQSRVTLFSRQTFLLLVKTGEADLFCLGPVTRETCGASGTVSERQTFYAKSTLSKSVAQLMISDRSEDGNAFLLHTSSLMHSDPGATLVIGAQRRGNHRDVVDLRAGSVDSFVSSMLPSWAN